jgi:hypothetical protein
VYSEIIGRSTERRDEVEAFIHQRYRQAFQANLDIYPDQILALFLHDGRLVAAAGLRALVDGFFSETYLDEPIDIAVTRVTGGIVERASLLEICSLASANSHVVFPLMSSVLTHGRTNGFSCGVFTATKGLRRVFRRLHLPLTVLGPACPDRLADVWKWGTYYDADPQVCALVDPASAATDIFPRCKELVAPAPRLAVQHG